MLAHQFPKPSNTVNTKDSEIGRIAYRVDSPVQASKAEHFLVGVYTRGGGLVVGNSDAEKVPHCNKLCRIS